MGTSGRLSVLDPLEVLRLVRLAGAEIPEPDELLVRRIIQSIPDSYHDHAPRGPVVSGDEFDSDESAIPIVELVEHWTLLDEDRALIAERRHRRLGFALMLKHYSLHARFPRSRTEIADEVVEFVARQIEVDADSVEAYRWSGSTNDLHRSDIRDHYGYRLATVDDQQDLTEWLAVHVARSEQRPERVRRALLNEMRRHRIESPTAGRITRMVQSALRAAEREWADRIARRLPAETRGRLMDLLIDDELDDDGIDGSGSVFTLIRSQPGKVSLSTMTTEVYKLYAVRSMELPVDLFADVAPKILADWRTRAAVEAPSHLRRHSEPLTVTLLAALVHEREREITDSLVELLIATVHRIRARAERRVTKKLTADFKRVAGKENLLFKIAGASLDAPDGAVREVVFPAVSGGEATLRDLVREFKAKGSTYQDTVRTTLRASYTNHYRSGLVDLLNVLEFRSNNTQHQPVMDALRLIRRYARGRNLTYYPLGEEIPEHRGTSRKDWEPLVYRDDSQGRKRVVRTVYEIVTFQALCDQLRCKEIWVVGADSFRNPDHDLPADFEARRTENYRELQQTPRPHPLHPIPPYRDGN